MSARIAHISDLHIVSGKAMGLDVTKILVALLSAVGLYWLLSNPKAAKEVRKFINPISAKTIDWLFLGSVVGTPLAFAALQSVYLGIQAWNNRKHSEQARQALLDHFNRARPSFVVITGDLTNVAHPREFRLAFEYVSQIQAIVGKQNVFVLPGNHDAQGGLLKKYSKMPAEKKLANYLSFFRAFHQREDGLLFPTSIRFKDFLFVGLDVSGAGFASSGHLPKQQYEAAGEEFSRSSAESLYRVLLLHHNIKPRPKVPSFDSAAESRLETWVTPDIDNADLVEKLASETGVKHIWHGHVHDSYDVPGKPPVFCAGSTPMNATTGMRGIQYSLYELKNGELRKEMIPVYF